MNPGQGELIDAGLRHVIHYDDPERPDPLRLEAIVHADRHSYTRPLPALQQLQAELRVVTRDRPGSHLLPPLSLAVRDTEDILKDDQAAHVALIQGLAGASLTTTPTVPDRATSLDALLTATVTNTHVEGDARTVLTMPALRSRGTQGDGDIAAAHSSHQAAVGYALSVHGGYPAIRVDVDVPSLARLATLHARADWVLTVDRHLGVGIFEDQLGGAVPDSFILDYAPDFVDGIGDRLTVTTTHRSEVQRILGKAMRELGLSSDGKDASDVLRSLSAVSGRLALRLLGDSTLARESVSLAALMMHLQDKGELDGKIIIPVDAHPEIFGPAARAGDTPARRCDLLLVQVTRSSFRLECVEVKARKRSHLPQALADDIADQVIDTQNLLMSRYFATDPPRDDAPLQWARWASLLHYYADRAAAHGLINADRITDIHKHVDRIEDKREIPQIALRGFVVSLEGDAGFPRMVRDVPIAVLTAAELGRLGFTTMIDIQMREVVKDNPATADIVEERPPRHVHQPDEFEAASQKSSVPYTPGRHAAATGSAGRTEIGPAQTGVRPDAAAELGEDAQAAQRARDVGGDVRLPDEAAMPAPVSTDGSVRVLLGHDATSRPVHWNVSTREPARLHPGYPRAREIGHDTPDPERLR